MSEDTEVRVLGGPQGSKALLDSLMAAVIRRDQRALSLLSGPFCALKENAPKCVDDSGNTIVHCALNNDISILRFTVEVLHGDVNQPNYLGQTPLHIAARYNFVDCCRYLLDKGASLSLIDSTFSTPLLTAANCGNLECLKFFLSKTEDPYKKIREVDKNKSTLLHRAALSGVLNICSFLIENGISIDSVDFNDNTPLLLSVKMGYEDLMDFFLEKGANPNHRDSTEYNTALHYAIMDGHISMAKKLLDAGTDVTLVNRHGNNVLHLIAKMPFSHHSIENIIVDLILAGCSTTLRNSEGLLPEEYADRSQRYLFSIECAQKIRQKSIDAKTQEKLEDRELINRRAETLAASRMKQFITEQGRQEEEERQLKEFNERARLVEDSRQMYEEILLRKKLFEESKLKKRKKKGFNK